jgi:Berberine and berberine like
MRLVEGMDLEQIKKTYDPENFFNWAPATHTLGARPSVRLTPRGPSAGHDRQ